MRYTTLLEFHTGLHPRPFKFERYYHLSYPTNSSSGTKYDDEAIITGT